MTHIERINLLNALQVASNNDPSFMGDAIMHMQRGIDSHIKELKEKALKSEMIAVAMHSKASSKRHSAKQDEWVDGMIKRYADNALFTNIDYSEGITK